MPYHTLLIIDSSQAVNRTRGEADGTVPTMATSANVWSLRAGRPLGVSEMAKLRGHESSTADPEGTSAGSMTMMLGMSMHIATAGFALIGLLGAFGRS